MQVDLMRISELVSGDKATIEKVTVPAPAMVSPPQQIKVVTKQYDQFTGEEIAPIEQFYSMDALLSEKEGLQKQILAYQERVAAIDLLLTNF